MHLSFPSVVWAGSHGGLGECGDEMIQAGGSV